MLRRVALSCYQSIHVTAEVALGRITQASVFLQRHQLPVPALQFLTIPSSDNHLLRRRRQVRNFTSVARSEPNSSSFGEDYDEWYSHGRVGHVTSEPIDDETDYFKSQSSTHAHHHRWFLLEELKQEASFHLHEQRALNASLADHAMTLAMEESDDDLLDDLDFSEEEDQVLEET